MSEANEQIALLRQLRADLERKYKQHGQRLQIYWTSFDHSKRAACIKAGTLDGAVLNNRQDTSLGQVHRIMPEWNLRDLALSGPSVLLDMMKFRATTSLFDQYRTGPNDTPGDAEFIRRSIQNGLRPSQPRLNCYTLFMDEEQYGDSYDLGHQKEQALQAFAPAIRAGLCVPQSTGDFIITRQIYLLQSLVILVDDILEQGSTTRNTTKRSSKAREPLVASSSKAGSAQPAQSSLSDLIARSDDQKSLYQDLLNLAVAEPPVLAYIVNTTFFSRPELLPDKVGRRLPAHTDSHISAAFFDAIHFIIESIAIWDYIHSLLKSLDSSSTDKLFRAIVLQELSNVCNMEYVRQQTAFKQQVQTGLGLKHFYRLPNVYDKAGNAKVALKGDPAQFTRTEPQLHYVLRLCQPETQATGAMEWITKLNGLCEEFQDEREKLSEREFDALSNLSLTVLFSQDLATVFKLPPFSRKNGQVFLSRHQELASELAQLKKKVDLHDFAVPIDNLLEPGVADKALAALDSFMDESSGSKMQYLYQNMLDSCHADLETQLGRAKAKAQGSSSGSGFQEIAGKETIVEQRRLKDKTRPVHSSVYDVPMPSSGDKEALPQKAEDKFRVASSTAEMFATLFDRTRTRGSVNWTAFEAGMAEVGFSITPKTGSIYNFVPPESMGDKRAITLHRPHVSEIEGYRLLLYSRRLMRTYGWGAETFEAK